MLRTYFHRGFDLLLAGILTCTTFPAASHACGGDCNGDDVVTVDEVLVGINVALGELPATQCPVLDASTDGQVTVDEIIAAVTNALARCPVPTIATIAGNGIAGLNGDGLSPLETSFYLPQDVTVGPDGDLYFADWNNHRIRRLHDGEIETVAGTGELGEAADGLALEVQFNHPTNVAFDPNDDMIIAAWHNSLIKRLDFDSGRVENLAGTGARSFNGDGGPANDTFLDLPSSVVVDSEGRVVFSDQANFRVRRIEHDGTVSTLCGSGAAGYDGDGGPGAEALLSSPIGQAAPPAGRIAVDSENRIYIADTGNHAIRLLDTDGNIYTIAGNGVPGYSGDDGPAAAAQLNTPSDVAIGSNGVLYVADTMNHAIRQITTDGIISTVAGTGERGFGGDGGPAPDALLDRPYGLDVAPNGDIYVCDTHNQRIRKISGIGGGPPPPTPVPTPTPVQVPCTDTVGSICTYVGTGATGFNGDGHDRLDTALYWPMDIEFMPSGRRVVLDWNNHRVREILPDETMTTIMGTDFIGDGPADFSDLTLEGADPLTVDLNHPTDLQELPNGDILLMAWHNHKLRVIDAGTGRVRVLAGAGAAFAGDGGPALDARVNQPPHGVVDDAGNLFLIDQRNQRIRVFYDFAEDREEAIVGTVAGTGEKGFNGDGLASQTIFNFPAGPNPEPSGGLALDDGGRLYFADSLNHRIRRIEFLAPDFSSGIVTTIAGDGEPGFSGDGGVATQARVNFPQDMEIGPDGNLYFADTNNNRVRRIDLVTGVITTVAGNGLPEYSGDGGAAVDAGLRRPFGVAFDEAGDLYISDSFNSRVRRVKR